MSTVALQRRVEKIERQATVLQPVVEGVDLEHWQSIGPAAWAESPDGWLMEDGLPIELEPWQRAILLAWWDHWEHVTTLAISNVKKTGKTTLNAVLTCWRWLALPGEHFCCANDLDQSQSRQFQMIGQMVERHPLLIQHAAVTKSKLTFEPTGSTLEAIEVDAAGRAGSNHLTSSHTEAWGIVHEGAQRAWEELTPPPGKRYGLPALRIADSYAGFLEESVIWHNVVDRGLAGERVSDWPVFLNGGLMLFHMEGEEAQGVCFRGTMAEAEAYYDEQRASLRAGTFSRLHLNQRAAGEERFVDITLFDALVDPACYPLRPGDYRPIVLAADAATRRDRLALVGCTWNHVCQRVELAYVREWEPQKLQHLAGGVDLDETIGAEILRLHCEHVVNAVYFDPYQFAAIANRLEKAGVNVIEFPQTAQRTQADQALYDAITSGTLAIFPSPDLRASLQKAAAKETPRGYRLAKQPGDDLAVALSMAHWGCLQAENHKDRPIAYSEGAWPKAFASKGIRKRVAVPRHWPQPSRPDAAPEPPGAMGRLRWHADKR